MNLPISPLFRSPVFFVVVSLAISPGAQLIAEEAKSPPPPAMPLSDNAIRQILLTRVDAQKQADALVAGIVSPEGRQVVAYGKREANDRPELNGDTVFEIGSITKVFTSLVLIDMVQRGEVSLDDPVVKYLPAGTRVPERAGRQITLRDLSTQTSGLPRLPDNLHPQNVANPYADYSTEQLYAFLSGYTLTRDIGEKFEYSNLGVGLLGQALSRRASTNYETMVTARILQPLGMKDTGIALSAGQQARLTPGHDAALKPVANWDLPTLAGAGALRSTANDLLTFLAANLGLVKTPLAAAMAAEVQPRTPTGTPNLEIAYGWFVLSRNGKTIFWHNGGTGGYRSFIGYDPAAKRGVVVLSNTSTSGGVDDIGYHLLDPAVPLASFAPPKEHQAITLDPKALEKFVGAYQLAPKFILTITAADGHLYAQASGQSKFEIFAEGPHEFFAKVVEITIRFQADPDENVTGLILSQGGRDTRAKRIQQ
jgi:CubicO group peptidase (beta-lactamase class C family)